MLESQGSPGEMAVFNAFWNPEEVGSDSIRGMAEDRCLPVNTNADRQAFSCGLPLKVGPRPGVGLLTSDDPYLGWVFHL